MAALEFACPYCGGHFEFADPPAGQAVTCPHCGAEVALPVDLPTVSPNQTQQAVQPSPPIEFVPPCSAPFIPLDIVAAPTTPLGRGQARRVRRGAVAGVRRISREEKERRRLGRAAVLMAVGLLMLMVALAVLSRF